MKAKKNNLYEIFLQNIGQLLADGRKRAVYAVNSILVRTYWEIGKEINIYELKSEKSLEYGSKLFEIIAKDLKEKYGRGFSRSNVIYMRLIYRKYRISQALSDQLSWSHYSILLGIEDDL